MKQRGKMNIFTQRSLFSPHSSLYRTHTSITAHTQTHIHLHNSHRLLPKCTKRSFNGQLAPRPQTPSHCWHSEEADSAWAVASAPQREQANHVTHSSWMGWDGMGIMRCSCRGDTFEPDWALTASDPDQSRCPLRSEDKVCACVCAWTFSWLPWHLALNLYGPLSALCSL